MIIECWVCMDKGTVLARIPVKIGNETYHNWYSLYCDRCERGRNNKIDYVNKEGTRYYEESVSKYFDTSELGSRNYQLRKNNVEKVRCRK